VQKLPKFCSDGKTIIMVPMKRLNAQTAERSGLSEEQAGLGKTEVLYNRCLH